MDRQPVVAGQFYPGTPEKLQKEVRRYLSAAKTPQAETLLAMVPHAGYVYSGGVAGKTLGEARLAETVLLLGPNHTGLGSGLALWDHGDWLFPGARVPVHEPLAQALLESVPAIDANLDAHLHEHSLEVVLPFLMAVQPQARIVPLAVSERSLETLLRAGEAMAGVLRAFASQVSIVVSSDMSHYISHEAAKDKDTLALERITALDPEGLLHTVRRFNITMCGVLPMTLGLVICRELGATQARVAAYATSGDVNRDFSKVVGYAGVLIDTQS